MIFISLRLLSFIIFFSFEIPFFALFLHEFMSGSRLRLFAQGFEEMKFSYFCLIGVENIEISGVKCEFAEVQSKAHLGQTNLVFNQVKPEMRGCYESDNKQTTNQSKTGTSKGPTSECWMRHS